MQHWPDQARYWTQTVLLEHWLLLLALHMLHVQALQHWPGAQAVQHWPDQVRHWKQTVLLQHWQLLLPHEMLHVLQGCTLGDCKTTILRRLHNDR